VQRAATEVEMRVALNDIETGLSHYVAKAREGEVVEITLDDVPVARIVGIPAAGEPGVARLTARGAAQWGGGKPAFRHPLVIEASGKTLSEMVLEERG
jgi:antitoxin (DNA-binding transcriptional repressor) of toxin-antitoxin stability system